MGLGFDLDELFSGGLLVNVLVLILRLIHLWNSLYVKIAMENIIWMWNAIPQIFVFYRHVLFVENMAFRGVK